MLPSFIWKRRKPAGRPSHLGDRAEPCQEAAHVVDGTRELAPIDDKPA